MRPTLTVIYTRRLEECRDFYAGLGMEFVAERHGSGPGHYAAVLADGHVFELYPAGRGEATGRLRLGLAVAGAEGAVVRDPDGRTVEVVGEKDREGPEEGGGHRHRQGVGGER